MKAKLVYLSAIMFCCSNVYCMNLLKGAHLEDLSGFKKEVTQIKKNNEAMKRIETEFLKPNPDYVNVAAIVRDALPDGDAKTAAGKFVDVVLRGLQSSESQESVSLRFFELSVKSGK